MGLKVLLADDSAAIKKVIQLSLQDYGIEIRSVGSGKEVLDVARSFNPDIAFVDVLLPHKTGYEIASEFKKDPILSKTPIVMLWSSFMSFDEGKFRSSGANDKLEKPFEVSGLRNLVNKYVTKTKKSPLNKHLEFPNLEFDQRAPKTVEEPATDIYASHDSPTVIEPEGWTMASFEDIPIPNTSTTVAQPPPSPPAETSGIWSDSEWIRKDLGKFKVPIPDENLPDDTIPFDINAAEIKDTNFLLKDKPEHEPLLEPVETVAAHSPMPDMAAHSPHEVLSVPPLEESIAEIARPQLSTPFTTPTPHQNQGVLTEAMLKEIREETRAAIEKIVWKLVPDIAANLVKEELQRILGDQK